MITEEDMIPRPSGPTLEFPAGEPKTGTPAGLRHGIRFFEVAGFACGLGFMVGDKVQEWGGVGHGISGTTVFSSFLLVAPFILGRASSGRAWEKLAEGISNRLKGGTQ